MMFGYNTLKILCS